MEDVGETQRAVATELGISNELLRQWIRQADTDSGADRERLSSTERQELRHLRAEVKALRAERVGDTAARCPGLACSFLVGTSVFRSGSRQGQPPRPTA